MLTVWSVESQILIPALTLTQLFHSLKSCQNQKRRSVPDASNFSWTSTPGSQRAAVLAEGSADLAQASGGWCACGWHSQKEHEKYFSLLSKYSTVNTELNQKRQEDRCHLFVKRMKREGTAQDCLLVKDKNDLFLEPWEKSRFGKHAKHILECLLCV